jgi:recombination associated protein RdgC
MWFKNLILYRLKTWNINAQVLEERLARLALRPCGGLDMQTRGWVPPKGDGEALVHSFGPQLMISLGVEKKLLPATVINQFAKAKAADIEEQQGYKPGRKQMKEIKEQVTDELLPRAFAIRRKTCAWIDPVGGWMVVDAASVGKADELIEMLHKTVDGIAFGPAMAQTSPVAAMTGWLSGNALPANFTIDQDCELRSRGDSGATVRYVRHTLEEEEVRKHIRGGKEATRLGLTWADRISFVLHENLQLKRIAPLDLIKEDMAGQEQDDSFDTDFVIMTGELRKMIPAVLDMLGGEAEGLSA